MGTATYKQKEKTGNSAVRVATKTSMALFNRHFKKTGERDFSLLKYKESKK
jgi:hypothetical protein